MTEITDRSPSIMPDLTGDFERKTGAPLSGSGKPISGNIQFSDMDAPMPDDSRVGNHTPSEMPDIAGEFERKTRPRLCLTIPL